MGKKVHIVPCGESNPLVTVTAVLLGIMFVCWLIKMAALFVYHHVILPAAHIALSALLYGSITLGALGICALVLGLIIWTRKRAIRHASIPSALSADRLRARLAGQDSVPAIPASAGAPYQADTTRQIEAFPFGGSKTEQDLKSDDDVYLMIHGIRPIDWDK